MRHLKRNFFEVFLDSPDPWYAVCQNKGLSIGKRINVVAKLHFCPVRDHFNMINVTVSQGISFVREIDLDNFFFRMIGDSDIFGVMPVN